MAEEKQYEEFSSSEMEKFQLLSRKLMAHCMIVRDKDKSGTTDYIFLKDRLPALKEAMGRLGYEVAINEEAGVIRYYVPGEDQGNRYLFCTRDKITLCCLWELYTEEIKKESASLSIRINGYDLLGIIEKYGLKDKFSNDGMRKSLAVMKRFNIINVTGDIKSLDCFITILPSIQFCLDMEAFRQYVDAGKALLEDEAARARKERTKALKAAIDESQEEEDFEDDDN